MSEKASHATDTTSKEVSLYSSSHWKDPSNRSKQLLDKYLATILPLPAALEENSNELRSPTSGLLRYDLTGILKRELVERTTSFLTVNSNHFKMASATITIEFEETQVRLPFVLPLASLHLQLFSCALPSLPNGMVETETEMARPASLCVQSSQVTN